MPVPNGTVVREFERQGEGDKADTKLLVAADEYNGHPFINVRIWERGPDGDWRPTRKGVAIRLSEAAEFSAAILDALNFCGGPSTTGN